MEVEGFEAAGWRTGAAPFGRYPARTSWPASRPDLWVRHTFELEQVPESPLVLSLAADEKADVFLNGVALDEAVPAGRENQKALVLNRTDLRTGKNLLAVHGRNQETRGTLDVGLDVGLHVRTEGAFIEVLNEALKARPDSQLLRLRAEEHVRRRRWKEAADDLLELVELDPTQNMDWLRAAPLLALAGDTEAYRRHALLPKIVPVSELPLKKYTDALDKGSAPAWLRPWALASRALASYRAGDARQALRWVPKTPRTQGASPHRALCLVVEALAWHQLGESAKARTLLTEAGDLIKAGMARIEKGEMADWNDWLYAEILRREAETLLPESAPKPKE